MNLKMTATEQRAQNDSFNDDMNMDEDDGGQNDGIIANIDHETADFHKNEVDHQRAFAKYKRTSCFAHLLQLVLP